MGLFWLVVEHRFTLFEATQESLLQARVGGVHVVDLDIANVSRAVPCRVPMKQRVWDLEFVKGLQILDRRQILFVLGDGLFHIGCGLFRLLHLS